MSGDGLRVVEDETKGLIVDQTIEKVSFCAPDRNHEKGFSYICRDGTTRRWMCHGFLALKESVNQTSFFHSLKKDIYRLTLHRQYKAQIVISFISYYFINFIGENSHELLIRT